MCPALDNRGSLISLLYREPARNYTVSCIDRRKWVVYRGPFSPVARNRKSNFRSVRQLISGGDPMARYGKAAGKSVKSAMHREKKGTLKSGKGGKGGKVTSRKQAIAIGLSEARKKGAKVPKKK
jgi:Family of unknown function (DUF6496)